MSGSTCRCSTPRRRCSSGMSFLGGEPFSLRAARRRADQPQLPRAHALGPRLRRPVRRGEERTARRSTATPRPTTRASRRRSASARGSSSTPPTEHVLVVDWIEARTCTDDDLDDPDTLDPRRGRLPHAAHRPAVPRRLRHVRRAAPLPARSCRSTASGCPTDYLDFDRQVVGALTTVLHAIERGHGRRATTTCSPPTSWTTARASGSSTSSTRATTTPASNSATSGARPICRSTGSSISSPSYYGAPSPAEAARARLFAVMAKYGWTLWASIQDAVSDVDFDFWQWGMEKYVRAVAEFRSSELRRL